MTDSPVQLLALYGTLRPGEKNHWLVRNIAGEWSAGRVHGWAYPIGWGPAEGDPGITLDAAAPAVEVAVLRSDRLDRHFREVDDFVGPGYRRVEAEVELDQPLVATTWIYETITDVE